MSGPRMVRVSTHPLIRHKIALLRDVNTQTQQFRELVGELAELLFYEATADLHLTHTTVRTPLDACPAEMLTDRVGIVPILRAGLGMADAMLRLLPNAVVWHLGLFRDH